MKHVTLRRGFNATSDPEPWGECVLGVEEMPKRSQRPPDEEDGARGLEDVDWICSLRILTVNGDPVDSDWGDSGWGTLEVNYRETDEPHAGFTTPDYVNTCCTTVESDDDFTFYRARDIYDGNYADAATQVASPGQHFQYDMADENKIEEAEMIGKMLIGEANLGRFESRVDDVNVYGDGAARGNDDYIEWELTAKVSWGLEYDGKDWGAKDLGIHLQEVKIVGTRTEFGPTEHNPYDDDQEHPQEFEVHWTPETNNGWNVKVDSGDHAFPMSVFPSSVDVDVAGQTIEVKF